ESYDLEDERRSGMLERRIRRIVGDAPYEIVWCSVYRAHSRIADRMAAGRVLLAGDCAHLVTPFGARGLNSGVQDAENAAWKIAYALRGYAPSRLVDSYDEERRAAAVENLAITTATMEFLAPETPEQVAHRARALDDAASHVAARERVDSGRLAEPYWYVDSSLTTPDASRPFAGRPPKGSTPPPAPGVLLPDVITRRDKESIPLRTLARAGLLILVGPQVDTVTLDAAVRGLVAHPVRVLDPEMGVREALGMRDDELWLIRPDAYIAAIVRDVDGVVAALSRLLGRLSATDPGVNSRFSAALSYHPRRQPGSARPKECLGVGKRRSRSSRGRT
ncbi:MAG TPA: FAD-dependent monooxygenase, partial [Nocardioidaceae bacterium]|nr:FAD-dependent monooxygenase [Nocardioidaceae bacterium]